MVSVSSPFIPSLVTELMVELGGRQITSKSSFLMKLKASVLKRGFVGRMSAKPLESCPTLCDPVDCSASDSSVHGILQARTLEWVAIPFSRRSSRLRDPIFYVSGFGRQVLYH